MDELKAWIDLATKLQEENNKLRSILNRVDSYSFRYDTEEMEKTESGEYVLVRDISREILNSSKEME